jgi:hypothetical protein
MAGGMQTKSHLEILRAREISAVRYGLFAASNAASLLRRVAGDTDLFAG